MSEIGGWKIINTSNYEHPLIFKYEMLTKSTYKMTGIFNLLLFV